ncbi:hypothetical protein NIES4071_102280 (plasmid) [Calothrix sp. NIES-4071]|nr:hypothetical protein NIES4071_102280 [Calothrix sp. NIES-4071]BAZ64609.1 hypothetical protein NIES4105_103420 [Calothrix sp. NIES-4105]
MISKKLQAQIDKYKKLPRWSSKFPPYIEQHFFDSIIVYHKDANHPDKVYCDMMPNLGAKPKTIVVKFDKQIVFASFNGSALIDRLPLAE